MIKKYGNEGNPKPIPDSYNQLIELVLYKPTQGSSIEYPIATGMWTSKGFLLKYGSLIVEHDKNEQYVRDIKKALKEDNMLEYNEGLNDYSICADIYLWSPATAGRLVFGYNTNGYEHWRNLEGILLGHLLWPNDVSYLE